MAIGARDRIDAMLVKKYAMQKVDNPTIQNIYDKSDKMYEAMNDYAQMHLLYAKYSAKAEKYLH